MALPRFYVNQELSLNSLVQVDTGVARHITKVLRMQSGAEVCLFNGDGHNYRGTLTTLDKHLAVNLTDCQATTNESPLETHLGQGMCRGDRMDYSLQKAVEMGVTSITPLLTERVQGRLDAKRMQRKMEHWQGVIISACEQCGRSRIPTLHPAQSLAEWLSIDTSLSLILDPEADQSLATCLQSSPTQTGVRFVIGPEGGLSDTELGNTPSHVQRVRLGGRILRTETAGTAVLAIMQNVAGDLGD